MQKDFATADELRKVLKASVGIELFEKEMRWQCDSLHLDANLSEVADGWGDVDLCFSSASSGPASPLPGLADYDDHVHDGLHEDHANSKVQLQRL